MEQLMEISRQVSAIDWRLWRWPLRGLEDGKSIGPRYTATLGLAITWAALFALCAQSMIVRHNVQQAKSDLYTLRGDIDRANMHASRLLTTVSTLKSQRALAIKAEELGLAADVAIVDVASVTK